MSRKIYAFGGKPPIPGESGMPKTKSGARGRMRLRIKKRARKASKAALQS